MAPPRVGSVSSPEDWYIYILEATSKPASPGAQGRITIHVGIAKDVQRRIGEHGAGKVKATAGKGIRLLGHSPATTHTKALQLEAWLKKQKPNKKRYYFA